MSTNLFYVDGPKAHEAETYAYEKEADLQLLIADNPSLLLRDSEKESLKLFLIEREQPVKEGLDSSTSYSLDHLFIDSEGIPVLVEVKRSTDTRTRREVVAQMLDYASRTSSWDAASLRASFRKNNSDDVCSVYDTDEFWETVSANLKAERMRLVFAADIIPPTLRNLIEFMSRNLSNIDVYGVEIARYKSGSTTFLMTNTVEYVVKTERRAIAAESRQWTRESMSEQVLLYSNQEVNRVFHRIVDFCQEAGIDGRFGKGAKKPNFIASHNGTTFLYLGFLPSRKVVVEFSVPGLCEVAEGRWSADAVVDELSTISGGDSDLLWVTTKYVYIDATLLVDNENMKQFEAVVKRFLNR